MQRYNRQIILPGFGARGQARLAQARVLVVGGGGLGCPALLYLAAGGVGHLGVVDFDVVDVSNLHRQILYNQNDVGKPKAEVAAQKLSEAYPDTQFQAFNTRLTNENALSIFADYDIIIDGSDNFGTRYLVNDACALLRKPLIYGAVYRYEGQIGVFGANINYRDLFPTPPAANEVPNCAEAGVLGVLPGIIGNMQANEAIKLIAMIGQPLYGKILTYNSLHNSFYEMLLTPNTAAKAQMPQNQADFLKMNYDFYCENSAIINEINWADLSSFISEDTLLVDVRQPEEMPKLSDFPHLSIPLSDLNNRLDELKNAPKIIVFCQSGVRSKKAVNQLSSAFPHKEIYSVKGGILQFTINN